MQGRKIFTMSYDDGVIWDEPFLKILNKYGIKATFNLNSGLLGDRVDLTQMGITFNHDKVEPHAVKALYAGHEVATHSATHPVLTKLDDETLVRQIMDDRAALSELVGYDVDGHAYPCGPYDDRVAKVLRERCGIRYARTVDAHRTFAVPKNPMTWHPTCHHGDAALFELAEKFLAAKPAEGEDLLFYVWGHTYEFNIHDDWDRIERFCQMISGHADVIYATNREALDLLGK